MEWLEKLEQVWSELSDRSSDDFVRAIEGIVADPAVPPERKAFEMACAHDSTGRSDLAVPGYRDALNSGLTGYEGRRAKIQLASSLRNLGQFSESLEILDEESTDVGDGLDDAVTVFHSLALVDVGREREAVAQLLHALTDQLPRYTASVHRYADARQSSISTSADRIRSNTSSA
ncbi:MAG: tetratricopeptide repeat protein [Euzebya sp.]